MSDGKSAKLRIYPACKWLTLVAFAIVGCATAPITGRRQLVLVPENNEIAMGVAAYQSTLAEESESDNTEYRVMVESVGVRLANVANRSEFDWEFRVIQSAEQNAFCLPGGKVAVYEGILPICENEAGLAVVMSHEVGHALARHGGERMSHDYIVDGAGMALSYITQSQEAVRQEQIQKVFGLTSKYGFVLPYSRKHELEADHMGLMLMAQAGYDPRAAPRFWRRFAEAQSQSQTGLSQYMSTHPADEVRASKLEELMPEAIAIYQNAPVKYGAGATINLPPTMVGQQSSVPAERFVVEAALPHQVREASALMPSNSNTPSPLR